MCLVAIWSHIQFVVLRCKLSCSQTLSFHKKYLLLHLLLLYKYQDFQYHTQSTMNPMSCIPALEGQAGSCPANSTIVASKEKKKKKKVDFINSTIMSRLRSNYHGNCPPMCFCPIKHISVLINLRFLFLVITKKSTHQ